MFLCIYFGLHRNLKCLLCFQTVSRPEERLESSRVGSVTELNQDQEEDDVPLVALAPDASLPAEQFAATIHPSACPLSQHLHEVWPVSLCMDSWWLFTFWPLLLWWLLLFSLLLLLRWSTDSFTWCMCKLSWVHFVDLWTNSDKVIIYGCQQDKNKTKTVCFNYTNLEYVADSEHWAVT